MCGILGLLLHDPSVNAAPEICEGLSLLQHRGQDACGIVTCAPRGRLYQCKANGMVRDVFTQDAIARLIGGMGIGHGEHFFLHPPPLIVPHFLGGVTVSILTWPCPRPWSRRLLLKRNHTRLLTTSLPYQFVTQPPVVRITRRRNLSTSIPRMELPLPM